MKKILSFLLTGAVFVMAACQSAPGSTSGGQSKDVSAMVTEDPYKADFSALAHGDYFANNDDLEELLVSSPYYAGAVSLPVPALQKFEELRKAKVDEAIVLSGNVYESARKLATNLESYRDAHFDLVAAVLVEDESLGKYATEIAGVFAEYKGHEKTLETMIDGMASDQSDTYTDSTVQYLKTGLIQEYSSLVYEDFLVLLANSAKLAAMLDQYDNANIKPALDAFNKTMAGMENLNADIVSMQENGVYLLTALRQIETADYNMTLAGLDYLGDTVPVLKEQAAKLIVSEDVEQDDIDMINDYIAEVEDYRLTMLKELESFDVETYTLPVSLKAPQAAALVPVARAGIKDTLYSAYSSVADTASAAASKVSGAVSSAASTTAEYANWGYQKVKSGVISTAEFASSTAQSAAHGIASTYNSVKETVSPYVSKTWEDLKFINSIPNKIILGGLDLAGAETRIGLEKTVGKYYYGKSDEDIARIQKEQYQKVVRNIVTGKSGVETLETATKYMENVENGTASLVEKGFENTLGKGYTSWAAGKVTNFAVGSVTSFAKSTYTLANPESSGTDKALSLIDIGLSFVGGSKSFAKFSSALKGTKKTGIGFIDKSANWLAKKFTGSRLKAAEKELEAVEKFLKTKGIPKDVREAQKLVRRQLRGELGRLKGEMNQLAKNAEAIEQSLKEVADSVKPGALAAGAKEEAKNALTGLFEGAYKQSLSGYWDAFKAMVGANAVELIDNMAAGEIDGKIHDLIESFLTSQYVPWNVVLCDGTYTGTWTIQGGRSFPVSMTIDGNDVSASGSFTMGAGGMVVSSVSTLTGTVDNAGNLTGTIASSATIGGMAAGGSTGGGSFSGTCDGSTVTLDYDVSGTTSVSVQGQAGSYGGSYSGTLTLQKSP